METNPNDRNSKVKNFATVLGTPYGEGTENAETKVTTDFIDLHGFNWPQKGQKQKLKDTDLHRLTQIK